MGLNAGCLGGARCVDMKVMVTRGATTRQEKKKNYADFFGGSRRRLLLNSRKQLVRRSCGFLLINEESTIPDGILPTCGRLLNFPADHTKPAHTRLIDPSTETLRPGLYWAPQKSFAPLRVRICVPSYDNHRTGAVYSMR